MMARALLALALFAVLASASTSASDAGKTGRKLKGILPGGGLTTSLPVGIPSVRFVSNHHRLCATTSAPVAACASRAAVRLAGNTPMPAPTRIVIHFEFSAARRHTSSMVGGQR
jgi:hypothetical protein